jgi:acyl dehydratase
MLNSKSVLDTRIEDRTFNWSSREAILYALGVGCGAEDLQFVYEDGLVSVPTFATVVCNQRMFDPAALGLDYAGLLHVGQSTELHRPFPPQGSAILSKRVSGLWDCGAERRALLAVETRVRDPISGDVIATVVNQMLARRDGGFGGEPPPSLPRPTPPAETWRVIPTRSDQALIFRLSGDWNPLHADPTTARSAGFPVPILHGMCTYAICCRAVMAEYNIPPERVLKHEARFSAPVYPGEPISVGMTRRENEILFMAQIGDRIVARSGRTTLRG